MDELEKLTLQKSVLREKERVIKKWRRKAEDAHKYKFGGMTFKAGLDALGDDEIIGLLFAQKDTLIENPSIKSQWSRRGIKASIKPEKVGVIVKFTDKPDAAITKHLKAKNLRWNRITKQWEGTRLRDEIADIVVIAGSENVTMIEL